MAESIWKKLPRPFFCLAPMAGVTDSPLRQVIAELGRPDLFFTEFVSCAGLCSADGHDPLMTELEFTEKERPIIAQLFGREPDQFERCAAWAAEMGYDGIDINTGCPDKKVQKQGSGAMLMLEPELTKKIVAATKRGAQGLPVSVKTRIGYLENNLEPWLMQLLEAEPAAISVHWRTKQQMYRGRADWSLAEKAVKLVRDSGSDTLLVGNGDIKSLDEGRELINRTGVDGVMIGRAILTNPWVFNPDINRDEITREMRIAAMLRHLDIFDTQFRERKHFLMIRKYVKAYINGFRDAKELRIELQTAKSLDDMRAMISR